MTTCAKCGNEGEGSTYGFVYGTTTGTETDYRGGPYQTIRTTTTHYKIHAPEQVFLCDTCITGRLEKERRLVTRVFGTLAVVLALAGVSVGIVDVVQHNTLIFSFVMLVFAAFLSGVMLWLRRHLRTARARTEHGEGLAMELRKPALREQGFDLFWSARQYAEMIRTGRLKPELTLPALEALRQRR